MTAAHLTFTIAGQPYSAKNRRRIVKFGNKPRLIKSEKALAYEKAVKEQAPIQTPLLEGTLRFTATLYYETQRPDLDAAIILDALQGIVYQNDRQVREQHFYHGIDKDNPRAEIVIEQVSV